MRPPKLQLLLSLLAAAACTRGDAAPNADGARRVAVEVHEVVERPLAPRVTATGVVGGKEEVALAFKIGGVIARIAVEPGMPVREGQVLAELSPVEISSEVAKAREGREKAQRDLARAKSLHADSVATLEQLQDATTAVQVAEQNVRIAEFNLRYATIVAPANGVVLHRQAEPGQLTAPGATVVTVRTTRRGLVLRAGVADRDVVRLHMGDRAHITLDAFPGRTFDGHVSQLAAAASPGTGTYDVEVSLEGSPGALASGLVGRVSIATRAVGRFPMVPMEALLEAEGDSATVFVVPAGKDQAVRRRVAIAESEGNAVAVSSGIAAGERVIVRGAAYVDEGTRLAVTGTDTVRRVK